jgi:predicted transcriptional regulator
MSSNTRNLPIGVQESEIKDVLKVAENLVRNNKVIQLEMLYKIAKRRLKYNGRKLITIINYLLKEKLLVEGSKLLKKDVLLNSYRKEIYNFITTYPGVHFSIIKKQVFSESEVNFQENVGSTGQFIWHLEVLLKFDFIKKIKVKNHSLFLPTEFEDRLGKYYFLLRDDINRKIVISLSQSESIEQAKIPAIINESKGNVYYHMNTLEETGVILSQKSELTGNKEVQLNPEKRDLFIKIAKDLESETQF